MSTETVADAGTSLAPAVTVPAPRRVPLALPLDRPAPPVGSAERRTGRSNSLSRRQALTALCGIAMFVAYVVWADVGWATGDTWPLVLFYSAVASLTLLIMLSGVRWRRFDDLSPAPGRVLAIVPVFNEQPELLEAAVRSLLDETIAPDEVHVVDDGSQPAVEPVDLPGVTWHRQENAGKREAQALILREADASAWDFVLTVDSDSVADPTPSSTSCARCRTSGCRR